MKIEEGEYHNHVNNYDGFCTKCDDFTRDGDTEPDAEDYECPQCGACACMGAENALIEGLLDISSE